MFKKIRRDSLSNGRKYVHHRFQNICPFYKGISGSTEINATNKIHVPIQTFWHVSSELTCQWVYHMRFYKNMNRFFSSSYDKITCVDFVPNRNLEIHKWKYMNKCSKHFFNDIFSVTVFVFKNIVTMIKNKQLEYV
jgi:hypothetical protein